MNVKRLVTGSIVGAIVLFVLGYLIFETLFAGFYAANAGSAIGVDRMPQVVWAVGVACIGYGALITLGIGSQAGAASVATGAKVGAVVGFLIWVTADFTLYGITNIQNLARTVVDPLLELVRGGITGAVLAVVLARIR